MLKELAIGLLVGFVGILALSKCAGAPALVECRLRAVSVLPANPDEISVGVARELARRVRACEASEMLDAGP